MRERECVCERERGGGGENALCVVVETVQTIEGVPTDDNTHNQTTTHTFMF
jgi:hypothetical protein